MSFLQRIFLSALICQGSLLSGQSILKYTIAFHARFHDKEIHFDDSYFPLNEHDSLRFETLKFYISGIELMQDNKSVWKEKNSFHLLDGSEVYTMNLSMDVPAGIAYNKIYFNIGIDSSTNSAGALGGDLDPTKGMYWSWQSGYINFKLEGQCDLSATRNNRFQFHLGGYHYPFASMQSITLDCIKQERSDILISLDKFIQDIDLSKVNQIMTPGQEAVRLSSRLKDIFSILK